MSFSAPQAARLPVAPVRRAGGPGGPRPGLAPMGLPPGGGLAPIPGGGTPRLGRPGIAPGRLGVAPGPPRADPTPGSAIQLLASRLAQP